MKTVAAAAAAKPLQSCPTLCDPRDGSPPGSPIPGILQARTLEWVNENYSCPIPHIPNFTLSTEKKKKKNFNQPINNKKKTKQKTAQPES